MVRPTLRGTSQKGGGAGGAEMFLQDGTSREN